MIDEEFKEFSQSLLKDSEEKIETIDKKAKELTKEREELNDRLAFIYDINEKKEVSKEIEKLEEKEENLKHIKTFYGVLKGQIEEKLIIEKN